MREILFRGKRKYNGEWKTGHLVKLGKESFSDPERYGIANEAIPLGVPFGCSIVCFNVKIDDIDPETVCQYTGLTDKHGKKIFEGDIIEYNDGIYYLTAIIKYEFGSFGMSCFKSIPIIFSERDNFVSFLDLIRNSENVTSKIYDIEVIGNIYDNPELLERSKDNDIQGSIEF